MTLECPKCKSSVAREGQKFCYRCGAELSEYYGSLNIDVKDPGVPAESSRPTTSEYSSPPSASLPSSTQVLSSAANEVTNETIATPPTAPERDALLHVLLPTGDAFDRELTQTETQIGKGPRNDIVITDQAVSSTHSLIRADDTGYTLSDLGSRNGTFLNGARITEPRKLAHGDVIGIGLSKLTFRFSNYSETGMISTPETTLILQSPEAAPLTEESLAKAVVTAGLVSQDDVTRLQGENKGRRLYTALVEENLVTQERLRDLMSRTFQIAKADLKASQVDADLAAKLSARLARARQIVIAGKDGDQILLAVADPTDTTAVEEARGEIGDNLAVRLATLADVFEQIDRLYGPRLIAVQPGGERVEFVIAQQEVEIGKASHNHLVLHDPTVSNTHAMLLTRDGGYSVVDLGSRNGTFVNGVRLGTQAVTLKHGDTIQMGQTLLTFRNRAETTANITATLSADALAEIRQRAAQMDTSAEKELAADSVPSAQTFAKVDNATPNAFSAASGAAAGATVAALAQSADSDKEEKEKDKDKKKKKKKKGDDRLKAAYISGLSRILAQVLAVVLSVGLAIYITQRSSGEKPKIETSKKGKAKLKIKETGGTPFKGGTFEASGVVAVPGTDGVLMVDDNRSSEILWMQVNEDGQQVGDVKIIPLGTNVTDPESITTDGSYYYILGSQSSLEAGQVGGLIRFTFDSAAQKVIKSEAISGLREFLIQNVPELKGLEQTKDTDGGLNIEGMGWDPDPEHRRLLFGLRSPLANGNALIVPITFRDPNGPFTLENLQLASPNAIQLSLGGLAIRDIQYDSRLKSFLIISGAPTHHEKTTFGLWEWNGEANQTNPEAQPQEVTTLNMNMKPEGVTRMKVGSKDFIFIVGDASSYAKSDYGEEPAP